MNSTHFCLPLLLMHLGWNQVVIVTDQEHETSTLTQTLDQKGVLYVIVTGNKALSGKWVSDFVQKGDLSWQPVYFALMCSLDCIISGLSVASQLDQELGTLTAFGLTSRWLLMTTTLHDLESALPGTDISIENVVVATQRQKVFPRKADNCELSTCSQLVFYTLQRTSDRHYKWTRIHHLPRTLGIPGSESSHGKGFWQIFHPKSPLEGALFPNIRNGYNGRRIQVLMKEWEAYLNFHYQDGTKIWYGLLMDYLRLTSNTLNFTYDLVDATAEEWGEGTHIDPDTGYLGIVIRKEVDIALMVYDTTYERRQVLDAHTPIDYSPIVMVYRKPPSADNFRMPLGPLSTQVVICVCASLVLVSLLLWVLECFPWSRKIEAHSCTSCSGTLIKLDKVMQLTGGAILSEPLDTKLDSRGGKLLLWTWWMTSLVVGAAYSGTLVSFLSVNKQTDLFSSPGDLLTKTHDYTWGVFDGGILFYTIKNSTHPMYQGLWSGIQRFLSEDPDVTTIDGAVLSRKIRTENFVFFMAKLTAISMFRGECNIVIKDAGFRRKLLNNMLPKGSALVKPLSEITSLLHANGMMSQLVDKWFPLPVCQPSTGPMVISLQHMQGVMYVVPTGLGLALMILTAEVVYFKITRLNTW